MPLDLEATDSFQKFLKEAKFNNNLWKTYQSGHWDASWADYLIDAIQSTFKIKVNLYTFNKGELVKSNAFNNKVQKANYHSIDLLYWNLDRHYDFLFPFKV